MQYDRDQTLLSYEDVDPERFSHVPFCELPCVDILLFDQSVSSFFFEFEPDQDIDLFLRHARFGSIRKNGQQLACLENLYEVASIRATYGNLSLAKVIPGQKLPEPLQFDLIPEAWATIESGGDFQGQITVCSCGISGCCSQYMWARNSVCLALFTITGARLSEVHWMPFCIEGLHGKNRS